MIVIDDVLNKVKENKIGGEEVIKKAYLLASKLHEGQFRQSGDAYITHPLNVSYILASTYNDTETIIAGLLHDTIEDTSRKINGYLQMNNETLDKVMLDINKYLNDNNIKCDVKLRIKEVYSTYKKMLNITKRQKQINSQDVNTINIEAIRDLFAIKIITDDYLDCYKAMGVVHREYKPDTTRIKDFIAVPKTNLYQSLHSVFFVNNCLVQAQIRTKEMDMIDSYGIPYYIYSKHKPFAEVQDEIREKLQFCQDLNFLSEYFERNDLYVEKVKKELFAKEKVYVRNRYNKTIELPLGSTPIDLAFLEGDNVGYNLLRVIVNGIEVPLDYELKNNDRVFLVMGGSPLDYWLDSVKTTRAREKILEYKRTCN